MAVLLSRETAVPVAIMAQQQQQQSKPGNPSNPAALSPRQQSKSAMFHDFLGIKPPGLGVGGEPTKVDEVRLLEASSEAASASAGTSIGGRGGPISTTSDLGSERQVGNFEGVPFYGPRGELSGPDNSNRLIKSKRSSSDSAFMGSARDGMAQIGPDSHENLHLMKMLRNGIGGERLRRYSEDETFITAHPVRHPSASFVLHPGSSIRNDPDSSKRERSIPMTSGPGYLFPPRGGHFASPLSHHIPPNRYREIHTSAPIISQAAADEGSRTGMKGPSILSSINAGGGMSEKNLPAGSQSSGKPTPISINTEPESSNPSSRHGMASASRQMTIFYGGQAHVFDDVHPNKADIIMALAGSNGGSWSTTFSPKSNSRQTSEANLVSAENETVGTPSMGRDLRGKFPAMVNSSSRPQTADRISNPIGGLQSGLISKDHGRNPSLLKDEKETYKG